ncbi:MAG: hypothetical protein A3J29_22410 [Acidobacteria bacterium RIFCSPLOWO2_12_FULL_67_14b]|nr:MAG: hypothetical protein A3J29_22410 [Acidobacteria bacterium RIFCSPLOWO2_12_FULL_67_14b]
MTRLFTAGAIAVLLFVPAGAFAQAGANPFTDAVKAQLAQVKDPVIRTAAKVPEDLYAFKPTPEVRSLGQLIGHIADANFGICGAGGGEKPPLSGIEKSTTSKAALQKALADSFAFCEKVLASMDDKKGAESIKFITGPTPRLMVLAFNNSHDYEHYGNLVTYMRLKGIIPPSSEPAK